jgi:predicted  nucleic acid-binding Zn-ribbon protein
MTIEKDVGELYGKIEGIDKKIDYIKQEIDEIKKLLYDNNGGLISDVKMLKEEYREAKQRKTHMVYWMIGIATIISSLVTYIMDKIFMR